MLNPLSHFPSASDLECPGVGEDFIIHAFFFGGPRIVRNDVIQGILIGFGLAFVSAQLYARTKAKKINGWITMYGLGEPDNSMLLRAAHAQLFLGPVTVSKAAMYWWTNSDGAGHALSAAVMLPTWAIIIYFWPRLLLLAYKRAILVKGFGDGPIPVNTLYTEPQNLFAEPLTAQPASGSNLMTVGVNHDTLATIGWLDLKKEPLVLHVPDMTGPDASGRYYSVQFIDPVWKRIHGERDCAGKMPNLKFNSIAVNAGSIGDAHLGHLAAFPRR